MLTHLPHKIGRLRLKSLKLSYNRLETLRHDVFLPALKGTLRQLWLSNNNLLELPNSLIEASALYKISGQKIEVFFRVVITHDIRNEHDCGFSEYSWRILDSKRGIKT